MLTRSANQAARNAQLQATQESNKPSAALQLVLDNTARYKSLESEIKQSQQLAQIWHNSEYFHLLNKEDSLKKQVVNKQTQPASAKKFVLNTNHMKFYVRKNVDFLKSIMSGKTTSWRHEHYLNKINHNDLTNFSCFAFFELEHLLLLNDLINQVFGNRFNTKSVDRQLISANDSTKINPNYVTKVLIPELLINIALNELKLNNRDEAENHLNLNLL